MKYHNGNIILSVLDSKDEDANPALLFFNIKQADNIN